MIVKEKVRENTIIRLIDDDEDLLSALDLMVSYEGWNTKTYHSAEEYLEAEDDEPGCLVLDIKLPGMNGLQLQESLAKRGTKRPIIFITGHGEVEMAVMAVKAGAWDFLQKPVNEDRLLQLIEEAAETDYLHSKGKLTLKEMEERVGLLTSREREILKCMCGEVSTTMMGERFGISVRTVQEHRSEIYKKLGSKKLDFSYLRRLV